MKGGDLYLLRGRIGRMGLRRCRGDLHQGRRSRLGTHGSLMLPPRGRVHVDRNGSADNLRKGPPVAEVGRGAREHEEHDEEHKNREKRRLEAVAAAGEPKRPAEVSRI